MKRILIVDDSPGYPDELRVRLLDLALSDVALELCQRHVRQRRAQRRMLVLRLPDRRVGHDHGFVVPCHL